MKSVIVQPSDKMSSGNPKFLEFRYCFVDDNLRKNAIVFTIDLIKPIRFSRVASFTKFLSCGQLFNRRSRCIFRYLKKIFVQYSKSRSSFIYCDRKMIKQVRCLLLRVVYIPCLISWTYIPSSPQSQFPVSQFV